MFQIKGLLKNKKFKITILVIVQVLILQNFKMKHFTVINIKIRIQIKENKKINKILRQRII